MDHGACKPVRVHTVVVSLQHSEKIGLEELRKAVMEKVIKEVIPARYFDERTICHVNPCGLFIIGGPQVKNMFLFYVEIFLRSSMMFLFVFATLDGYDVKKHT